MIINVIWDRAYKTPPFHAALHFTLFCLCNLCIQEEDCPGQEADNYVVHVLTTQMPTYVCTHRELRTMSSMQEVVLNFTITTDVLALNRHYLGVIEAQNHMGGRNSSEIHFSKLYAMTKNLELIQPKVVSASFSCSFGSSPGLYPPPAFAT